MADHIITEMDGIFPEATTNADIAKNDTMSSDKHKAPEPRQPRLDGCCHPHAAMPGTGAHQRYFFDVDAEAVPVDMIPMPGLTQALYPQVPSVGVNANSKNTGCRKGGWPALPSFGTAMQSQYGSMVQRCGADCLGKLDAVKVTVSGAKTGKVTGAHVGDLMPFTPTAPHTCIVPGDAAAELL